MKCFIYKLLKSYNEKIRKFGLRISVWDFTYRVLKKNWILEKKHQAILSFLYKDFSEEIKAVIKENHDLKEECIKRDSPIWMFWWQGLANAPELVQACVNSIKRHSGAHPVIVISEENWEEYISLSQKVITNFQRGKISVVHLSDIIRISLLQKYGGIWMDATIYLIDSIDKDLEGYIWYSQKRRDGNTRIDYVSKYLWSTFFFACGKNNKVLNFHKKLFDAYFEKYDILIDYFLQDYIFRLAYDCDIDVRKEIDIVPPNNEDTTWIQGRITKNVDYSKYNIVKEKTTLFKLNYRINGTIEEESFYNHIIRGSLR